MYQTVPNIQSVHGSFLWSDSESLEMIVFFSCVFSYPPKKTHLTPLVFWIWTTFLIQQKWIIPSSHPKKYSNPNKNTEGNGNHRMSGLFPDSTDLEEVTCSDTESFCNHTQLILGDETSWGRVFMCFSYWGLIVVIPRAFFVVLWECIFRKKRICLFFCSRRWFSIVFSFHPDPWGRWFNCTKILF